MSPFPPQLPARRSRVQLLVCFSPITSRPILHLKAELSLQGDDFTRQMCHMYAIFEEVVGGHLEQKEVMRGHKFSPLQKAILPLPPIRTSTEISPTRQALRTTYLYGSPGVRRKRMQSFKRPSESSTNPLLDTISVLTCDSDEYFDLTSVYQQPRDEKRLTGGDADSIGYAGSNSIDSGYKSLCPTPEIPESSPKPKILMGTKVMLECHKPRAAAPPPAARRSDLDVNLDHLMYLRQSLISAIQRCETSSQSSRESSPSSPRFQRRQFAEAKSVRFDTDVARVGTSARSPRTAQKQSKSILKDPLCASIRSHLSCDAPDSTFEEEIDALLYGKAEYYDLESVEEFPCSYVTMIEDKYRSVPKVAKAKVKKLKEDVSHEPVVSTREERVEHNKVKGQSMEGSVDMTKNAKSGSTKYRFTEVAKCMLEIIEDIQYKKQATNPDQNQAQHAKVCKQELSQPTDYHVYEEIMYDLASGGSVGTSKESPPPLPARPSGIFQKFNASNIGHRSVLYGRDYRANTYSGNRPKQRSNLYSLFSDQSDRRHLSQSLEQEWKGFDGPHASIYDDDYGFQKAFHAT